jgi:tRNA1Val (adenine37-N6)-methyltransferase
MSRNPFCFKEFVVNQNEVTMPVTTDACLLGALAVFGENDKILDIGTGTGLLCLMLAQRYSSAAITGVELDETTATVAQENVKLSKWKHRIDIQNVDCRKMGPMQYDGIICNPPFFENQLPSVGVKKSQARHTESLTYAELANTIAKHLRPEGLAWLVFPSAVFHLLKRELHRNGLFAKEKIAVASTADKKAHVDIVCVHFHRTPTILGNLTVYEAPGMYTKQAIELLSSYYLTL